MAEAEVTRLDAGASLAERQAVVRIGGITLILAARRRPYHNQADFTQLGLDPAKVRLLVVKSGYLSPELAPPRPPQSDGADRWRGTSGHPAAGQHAPRQRHPSLRAARRFHARGSSLRPVPRLIMGPWLDILRRHRVVRASAAAIFLYGFAGAATSPCQSMIAIREVRMRDHGYAALALASSVAYVVMAIGVGVISDRFQSYRRPLIFVSIFGILGDGLVWAVPSVPTFTVATLGPLALFHSINSRLFGNVRAHSSRFDTEEARISNALMRIMISRSWVLMPAVVGLMLSGRQSMIAAYLIAALVVVGILLTVTLGPEPDIRPEIQTVAPLPDISPNSLPEADLGPISEAPSELPPENRTVTEVATEVCWSPGTMRTDMSKRRNHDAAF